MSRRVGLVLAAAIALTNAAASPARAQQPLEERSRPSPFSVTPTNVELMIGCQAVLHAVDVFTTAYDMSLSSQAREGNPLLKPLEQHPTALAITSSAIDILQAYTIEK